MTGLRETLELVITGNASGAISEMQKLSSETQKHLGAAESAVQKFSTGAMKIGAAGMGIGGFLTMLGDKEQAAEQQLDTAIRNAGQAVEDYSGKIDDAVHQGEQFGHNAVETRTALTRLVEAYNDTGKALDEMQLVENLAADQHESLSAAADQVARAHGGAAKLFKLYNIQVGDNIDGTKNYDGALTELARKLDGQAAASMAGVTGWLEKQGAKFEDITAQIGENYGPAILGVSTGLTALGGIMSGVGAITSKLSAAKEIDTAVTAANTDSVFMLGEANRELAVSEEATTAGAVSMSAALGVATVGVGAIVAGFMSWRNQTSLLDDDVHGLADGIQNLSDEQLSHMSDAIDQLIQSQTYMNVSMDKSSVTTGIFNDLLSKSPAQAQRFADAMAAAGQPIDGATEKLQQAATAAGDSRDANDKWAGSVDAATGKIKQNTSATDEMKQASQRLDEELKQLNDTERAATDPLFGMYHALQDNKDALDAAKKAGGNNADANMKVAETALAVDSAARQLAAGVQTGTVSLEGSRKQLDVWVYEGLLTKNQADQIYDSFVNVADAADALQGKNIDMVISLHTAGLDAIANAVARNGINSVLPPGTGYASGGQIPGPKGAPLATVVHGGEYVMTADMVDAIKTGRGWNGGSSSSTASSGVGGTTIVQIVLDSKVISEVAFDGALAKGKRNGSLTSMGLRV